jgi:hypothetical protein
LTGGNLSANSGVDVVFGAGRSRFGRIGDGSADVESGLGDRRGIRVSDPGTAEVRLVSTHLRGAQSVMDGGWWPRARDRSQELPALLTGVGSRFGVVVVRVSLSATVWDATPEQISVGDRIVQVVWVWAPDHLQAVLATLSIREAGVIRLRFGLTDGQPHTLDEIGRVYGVTRERIRQIESHAMTKLRHPARARTLHDYLV